LRCVRYRHTLNMAGNWMHAAERTPNEYWIEVAQVG
jgi:hypothetical protein